MTRSKRIRGDFADTMEEGPTLNLVHGKAHPYDQIHRLAFNENSREIFVDGVIDEDFGGWFNEVHRYLTQPYGLTAPPLITDCSEEPITVWLNTGGGDVQSMFMFYDIVKASPVDITVRGYGNVCSAGVLMLACAHKRQVSKNCVMMIHQYSVDDMAGGRYQEMKDRRKWADWTHNRMIELYAECTPPQFDARYWKGIFERKDEYWLLGGQAIVDSGLADEVWG